MGWAGHGVGPIGSPYKCVGGNGVGDYPSSTLSGKITRMPPATPVQSGKKYLSVRCNSVGCDAMLAYAELPDKMDSEAQDQLERRYHGIQLNCPDCGHATRVYEGMTVFVR